MAESSTSFAGALERAAGGLPVIVLAGRANAGKSTLFNRLSKRGRAITSAIAGTTRDLNLARAEHDGREFMVVDSGGLEFAAAEQEPERATAEALRAVAAATVVVFLIDGRAGVSGADREALDLIRETGRPIILAVNKIEHASQEAAAFEAYSLGIPAVLFISAAHGRGIEVLLDEIIMRLPTEFASAAEAAPDLRFALIGRPNVGKSSLFNRLAGYERAIVADRPGTTRDPVDLCLKVDDHSVLMVDTAGVRRPTKVEGELERYSVGRAIETIRRAEVLGLVVDATEGITDQDTRLARLIEAEGRALIVICNKWDLAAALGRRVPAFVRQARSRYPFLGVSPILFTSALTGDGIREIVPAAVRASEAWRARFQTAELNRILSDATIAMDPPLVAGRRLKLMYVTQIASAPPRLAIFSNMERDIPVHYLRFLESRFRVGLELENLGTPLRLEFRRAQGSTSDRASYISAARRNPRPS